MSLTTTAQALPDGGTVVSQPKEGRLSPSMGRSAGEAGRGGRGGREQSGIWVWFLAAQHKAHYHTASAHKVCHGCYSHSPTLLRWLTPTPPCTTSSQAGILIPAMTGQKVTSLCKNGDATPPHLGRGWLGRG